MVVVRLDDNFITDEQIQELYDGRLNRIKKETKRLKVLVACEESQTVCRAFRDKGIDAFSCDILPCSGRLPEYHIQGDVLQLINGLCEFETVSGDRHYISRWDLIIAHPPCTYLTVTGNRWFNVEKYGNKAIERLQAREKAIKFFIDIANANCNHIAIENPIGIISSVYRKPDQIIQPYMFGDPYEKKTCLWLLNLPLLKPTNIVNPPERVKFASGKTLPKWFADCWKLPKEECARQRSKTFPGIAAAMAEQWGCVL